MSQPEDIREIDADREAEKKQSNRGLMLITLFIITVISIPFIYYSLRVPVLGLVLVHGNDSMQKWSFSRLKTLGAAGAPGLVAGFTRGPGEVQILCIQTLIRIGEPAIPYIVEALNDDVSSEVKYSSVQALGYIKEPAEVIVPALVKLLNEDEDFKVREEVAMALGAIGKKKKEAVPALIKLLKQDDDSTARRGAALALGYIGKPAKEAVPALLQLVIEDDGLIVRETAARALGEMGCHAKTAIPALIKASEDKDSGISYEATKALKKIRKDLKNSKPNQDESTPDIPNTIP